MSKAMVKVHILETGTVQMDCDTCLFSSFVPFALSESVFWDAYLGRSLDTMLGHIQSEHND